MTSETVVLWVHLLAAMFWVGGQVFVVAVVQPALKRAVAPDERTRLMAAIGRRFLLLSWLALAVLVFTGVANVIYRRLSWSDFATTGYGRILGVKIVLVAVILVLTAIHSLYLGGRLAELARHDASDPSIATRRRALQTQSVRISALNLLLNLIVVLLAVQLVAMS